eukprot:scaffold87597_cov72-Phaeocystis_antarctica.AAC.2
MTSKPRWTTTAATPLSRSEEFRLKAAAGTGPVPSLAASRRPDEADEADEAGRRTTLPSSPTKLTSLATTVSSKRIGLVKVCAPADSRSCTMMPLSVVERRASMTSSRAMPPAPPTCSVCRGGGGEGGGGEGGSEG